MFSKSFARFFGADHGAYRAALADGWEAAVDVLLPRGRPAPDLAAYLADRAAQGVVAEIAMGSPERLPDGDTVNDRVLDLPSRFRDRVRVRVWAGIGSRRTLEARHPRLTLVAGHAGRPDVMETLLTAARHPRVYLEFSSHRARNMASPGSGGHRDGVTAGSRAGGT